VEEGGERRGGERRREEGGERRGEERREKPARNGFTKVILILIKGCIKSNQTGLTVGDSCT
jgi:hypothetical protein